MSAERISRGINVTTNGFELKGEGEKMVIGIGELLEASVGHVEMIGEMEDWTLVVEETVNQKSYSRDAGL